VSKMMADYGVVVVAALISPYRADRDMVRSSVGEIAPCMEIDTKASLLTCCEGRDRKGLYKQARASLIKYFTGIDDPYEEPLNPELVLDSNNYSINDLATEMVERISLKIQL
jgi:adenylylsulfate kinase